MQERLNPLAESILSMLIFEESFGHLLSDLPKENAFAVADELKNLIVRDYVKPCRDLDNDTGSGILYDSDKLTSYSFVLTARGISYLEKLQRMR